MVWLETEGLAVLNADRGEETRRRGIAQVRRLFLDDLVQQFPEAEIGRSRGVDVTPGEIDEGHLARLFARRIEKTSQLYDLSSTNPSTFGGTSTTSGPSFRSSQAQGTVRAEEYATMRPAPADTGPWRSLGAPIRLGEDGTCLFLNRAALAFPLPAADRPARDAARAALAPLVALHPRGGAHVTCEARAPA